jgi:type I restriction enzyme S subunit
MKFGLKVQVIENIISVLEQHPKVDKAFVFGSRAKGNYRPDSDIDIAIKGNEITTDDIIAISVAIETKGITHKFDLIDYDSIKEPALKEHIDRVGIEFYSRLKEIQLRDISSDISYGYTASAASENIGPKFLRITDITSGRVNWETVPYCKISEKDHQKYKLRTGDIVIARTGATTGFNSTIKDNIDAVFASYLIRFQIDRQKADPFYVGYVLQSSSFQDYVDAIAGGSAQPGANAQQFADYEFLLPHLQEQTAIASMLSSLDDKIDLLHRQNKTLEQLAETLFRHWFVEEAEEGWVVGKLDDLAVFCNGKSRPNEIENGEIPIYGGNGILGFTNQSNYEGLSIIIGRVGAYCGSLYLERKPIWLSDNALLARGKKENYTFYLFYLLKSLELNSMAEGSSHPLLTQTLLKSINICIPPSQKVLNFNEQVSVFWNNIYANQTQIRTLTQTRDTLLPKLMSGEVRVEM